MSASLVGSEMCIRDRCCGRVVLWERVLLWERVPMGDDERKELQERGAVGCLLYTSDAADDM
eukprot:518752-Alexandrium_andersonii.AAC.1